MNSPAPLIDIGLNLSNRQFADDIPAVLQRAWDAGVSACILTGTSLEESERVIELCEQYAENFAGKLYCTAGVHPHHADEFGRDAAAQLQELTAHVAVKAIGETGLDFHRNYSSPAAQEKTFTAQLELAAECRLPLFMHEREASQRQYDILRHYRDHLVDGVIHCFTGSKEALFRYLDMDLYIGITGWICDERRGLELQRLVASVPEDRLMIETDAPYLLPRNMTPKPTTRRNEPAFLPWVLEMVAHCRETSVENVAHATYANAKRFFQLAGD